MELIGLKVKHTVFGAGVITEMEGNYITVEFAAKTTRFVYPDAFEKFLKAEDSVSQQAIVDEINDAKAAAEQKRQAEEAARKAAEEQRRAAVVVAAPKAKKSKTLDEMLRRTITRKSWPDSPSLPINRWKISLVFAFPVSAGASIRQTTPLF